MIKKLLNCPACNKSNPSKVISLDDEAKNRYLRFSSLKYNNFIDDWIDKLDVGIDKCLGCGHHFYREQPSQEMLFSMYERGQYLISKSVSDKRHPTSSMIREMNRLKKIISVSKPKMLDYGSGFGRWARAASQVGFDVAAYEPSRERGEEDSETEFTIVHDLIDLKGHFFDIINLEQVLEHVSEPVTILNNLHGFCKSNTVLRISVPNILRCPEGSELWKNWPYDGLRVHTMAPFEHLHGFTPQSLMKIADRTGYRKVNGLQIWKQYSIEMLRSYLGKLFPKIGQTFLLLKPNK